MARQTRKPAKGLAARPSYLNARYSGYCKCGSRIGRGELICYDSATKQSLCMKCGRSRMCEGKNRLVPVEPPSETQSLVDRLNTLKALPEPLSENAREEVNELTAKVMELARLDASLRALLIKTRAQGTLLAITARYAGKCLRCRAEQLPGEAVAYDTRQRKIICFACVTGD